MSVRLLGQIPCKPRNIAINQRPEHLREVLGKRDRAVRSDKLCFLQHVRIDLSHQVIAFWRARHEKSHSRHRILPSVSSRKRVNTHY